MSGLVSQIARFIRKRLSRLVCKCCCNWCLHYPKLTLD